MIADTQLMWQLSAPFLVEMVPVTWQMVRKLLLHWKQHVNVTLLGSWHLGLSHFSKRNGQLPQQV